MSYEKKDSMRKKHSEATRHNTRRVTSTQKTGRASSKPSRRGSPANTPKRRRKTERKLPAFLEVILAFFVIIRDGICSFIDNFWMDKPKNRTSLRRERIKRSLRGNYILLIIFGFFSLALISYGLTWFFTNKNAVSVFMNSEEVGIISETNLTEDDIKNQAIAKLKSELGENAIIEVYDTITIKPVHAAKEEIVSYDALLKDIYTNFNYKVQAYSIDVDGISLVVLKSLTEANEVLDEIKQGYYQNNIEITSATFVEKVEPNPVFVSSDQISSKDDAFKALTKTTDTQILYKAVKGDSYNKIATVNNITMADIQRLNPGIDMTAPLQIGQELALSVAKPVLSVRTVQPIKYQDIAPKKTLTQENPDKPVSFKKVIQQGKDGQREICENIIRINGFEEPEREFVSEKIITDPVTEIIEVGTKK